MSTVGGRRDEPAPLPPSEATAHVHPGGECSAEQIRVELDRILATPLFAHSRRYPSLLRHVVESTLAGRAGELKERTIGVEVFGRPPAYDTNQDPVVRTTAGEVRKRLAQYYQQDGRDVVVRIDLPAGSYVPRFQPAGRVDPGTPEMADREPVSATAATPVPPAVRTPSRSTWLMLLAGVAVAASVVAVLVWRWSGAGHDVVQRVWAPLLNGPAGVLIAVGPSPFPPIAEEDPRQHGLVSIEAARSVARVLGILEKHGKQVAVRPVELVTLEHLKEQPYVLVGGYNNPWTLRFTAQLRFGYGELPRPRLVDRRAPATKEWVYTTGTDASGATVVEDYGIAARFHEPSSNQVIVMVAGLNRDGTAAVGEVLTSARYLEPYASVVNAANFEIVVATTVINGAAGPPRVVATHTW